MKTLKLSLIGIFLFSTMLFSQDSNAKSITETSANTLRAELIEMIQNPNLREHGITEAEVQLQFTISRKGEIEILKVESDNDYLNAFVRSKIENKRINIKDIREDKVYFLTVKFELV